MIKKIVAILVTFMLFTSSTTFIEAVTDYDKAMVNTLATIRVNVKKKNSKFLMLLI